MTVSRKVLVSGDVQGVFFRSGCREEARSRGVAGYASNLPDGRVLAVFEGEEADVTAMIEWSRKGPETAQVQDIDVSEQEPEGLRGFEIR